MYIHQYDSCPIVQKCYFLKSFLLLLVYLIITKCYAVFKVLNGGDEEDRTPDPLRARQVLSQLSYTPTI